MFQASSVTASMIRNRHFSDALHTLNAYSLAGRFNQEIDKLASMTKKDRGLGRSFSRLLEQLSRPTLENGNTIDFTFELQHRPVYGFAEPDWYTQLLHTAPALRMNETFEFCALTIAHDAVVEAVWSLFSEKDKWWLYDLILVRFEQVRDEAAFLAGQTKTLPVISVVVPLDIEAWSVSKKLQYMDLLRTLAFRYHRTYVSGQFCDLSIQLENNFSAAINREVSDLMTELRLRKFPLTTVFKLVDHIVPNVVMKPSELMGDQDCFLEQSPTWVSNHVSTFLA